MPQRDDANTTVLHPSEVKGSMAWYINGCRCDGCRAMNAKSGRDRRRRLATGVPSPYDCVPSGTTREAIARFRRRGMVWEGMQELVGVDRRDLQRILNRPDGRVTRRMEALVLAAERRLEERPVLVIKGRRVFTQGARVRWMIGCLMARGWTSDWVGSQIGWNNHIPPSKIPYSRVTVDLWGRIEGVFKAYHEEWGPSRMSAVRAWRSGHFFADCYDWEDARPDYRPIPGTFHPDLVGEACEYKSAYRHRRKNMVMLMHQKYGQWEREACASAAFWAWQAAAGLPIETDGERICAVRAHRHDRLPSLWAPGGDDSDS